MAWEFVEDEEVRRFLQSFDDPEMAKKAEEYFREHSKLTVEELFIRFFRG